MEKRDEKNYLKEQNVNISVYLPVSYYEKLRDMTYDGVSMSYMCKKIIINFIEKSDNILKEDDKI